MVLDRIMENLIKTSNVVLVWKGKQLSVNVKGKRRGEIFSKKKNYIWSTNVSEKWQVVSLEDNDNMHRIIASSKQNRTCSVYYVIISYCVVL